MVNGEIWPWIVNDDKAEIIHLKLDTHSGSPNATANKPDYESDVSCNSSSSADLTNIRPHLVTHSSDASTQDILHDLETKISEAKEEALSRSDVTSPKKFKQLHLPALKALRFELHPETLLSFGETYQDIPEESRNLNMPRTTSVLSANGPKDPSYMVPQPLRPSSTLVSYKVSMPERSASIEPASTHHHLDGSKAIADQTGYSYPGKDPHRTRNALVPSGRTTQARLRNAKQYNHRESFELDRGYDNDKHQPEKYLHIDGTKSSLNSDVFYKTTDKEVALYRKKKLMFCTDEDTSRKKTSSGNPGGVHVQHSGNTTNSLKSVPAENGSPTPADGRSHSAAEATDTQSEAIVETKSLTPSFDNSKGAPEKGPRLGKLIKLAQKEVSGALELKTPPMLMGTSESTPGERDAQTGCLPLFLGSTRTTTLAHSATVLPETVFKAAESQISDRIPPDGTDQIRGKGSKDKLNVPPPAEDWMLHIILSEAHTRLKRPRKPSPAQRKMPYFIKL